jgi:hypothetical protein
MSSSPHQISSNFSSPLAKIHSPSPKRLSYLLSNCQNLQKNVSRARVVLAKSASEKLTSFSKLRSIFKHDLNENFMEIYKSSKRPQKPTSSSPVSNMKQKIESLLSPRREKQKFTLKRRCDKQVEDLKKEYVASEEVYNTEAQDFLKTNKRNFGEMFKEKPNPIVANFYVNSPKPPLIPYVSKYSFRSKEKELLDNYHEEKKNFEDRIKVEKLIHKTRLVR